MDLTKRQQEIFDFIGKYSQKYGYPPTVRDIGNEANYAAVDLRRAINEGWFVGPTVLAAGKIIGPYGGQSHRVPSEEGEYWKFEYLDADGPEAVRAAVRKNIFYGVDVIKLVADNSAYHYSVEEVRAAVDEALAAKQAGERRVILFNLSGHGLMDMTAYDAYLSGHLQEG